MERASQVEPKRAGGVGVRHCGSRADDQLAIDDLRYLRVGDLHQILVGGAALRALHDGEHTTINDPHSNHRARPTNALSLPSGASVRHATQHDASHTFHRCAGRGDQSTSAVPEVFASRIRRHTPAMLAPASSGSRPPARMFDTHLRSASVVDPLGRQVR